MPFELYQDTREDGAPYFYLAMDYITDEGRMRGGFMADLDSNLVDLDGNIITSRDDLENIISSEEALKEFSDNLMTNLEN